MKRNWLFLLLISMTPMIFFGCSKSNSSTTLVGNWTNTTDILGVGRSGAVCFTIADSAYIGLGYNQTNNPKYLSDFYRYDYNNNKWGKIASFPDSMARTNAVAFSVNNKGYVGTGYDGNNYLSDFWEYNPATNSWRRVKTLAIGSNGRRNAVAFAIGSNGYVGTGFDGGNNLMDFWKYTPDADSGVWSPAANIGFKRAYSTSFVINGYGYVVTGENNGQYCQDFWKYDPTADKWTRMRDIANTNTTQTYDDNYTAIERSYGVGFSANNLGYVACGIFSGLNSTVWEYDPINDLWIQRTSYEGSARSEAVGFSINNNIFVGTGKNGTSAYDDFWKFKPTEAYDPYN
jgi:N-acetylneuraminic acid mutarotase